MGVVSFIDVMGAVNDGNQEHCVNVQEITVVISPEARFCRDSDGGQR